MPDKPTDQPTADGRPQPADDLSALCDRVIEGAPGALDRLHARLTPGLLRHFGRKLGGGGGDHSNAADELVQQTWIAFWQALTKGKYDPSKSRPSTFLYAVAGNIWLRHLRAVGRARPHQALTEGQAGRGGSEVRHADSPGGGGIGAATDDPADAAAEASAIDTVRRALRGEEPTSGLSEDDRQILRAIARGRTDRELAAELGVAPSTAHARKRIATEKLSQFLRSRGFADALPERGDEDRANN